MKHIVTVTHEIEAESWDLAVAKAVQEPLQHITACQVKSPGRRLQRVIPSNLKEVLGAASQSPASQTARVL